MHDDSPDPLVGSTVDERYLVLSKVAHGGMSTVYLAKDLRLNRNIALKILHPHLATDNAFIARLSREAQSAASLSHPHVVQIHDHGVGPQHAYLVFEFIDGYTLRDVIEKNGALTPRLALNFLDPVVEGLAAAHNAGLVHRDVKPENVLISRQGWVKIGDFGLSRAVTNSTNTGALFGTVGYIAPELARGEGGDARSDIYSAGVMLYELLTGHQPFRATIPVAVVMSHLQEQMPAPSEDVPGLPPVMDELVRYMTEKDPDHRPANGGALLEDLRHIRASLSPAELDFGTGTAPSIPLFAEHPTIALGQANTTVLAVPSFPTSELPRSPRLYVEDPHAEQYAATRPEHLQDQHLQDQYDAGHSLTAAIPTFAPGLGASGAPGSDEAPEGGGTPSAPRSKRQASAAAKAKTKAAATPQKDLGPKHPLRRSLLWIMLVLVLIVLTAGAGWFLAMGPGALATIPEVGNKSVEQALTVLHGEGFETTSTTDVHDEKVAAGFVIATDPGAGSSQRKFSHVTVQVSIGPVLYVVPKLTGQPKDSAAKSLADAKLSMGTLTEEFNENVAAGVVLKQDPGAGKEFRANTKVNLVLSKGPKPIPVPTVVNKSQGDAVTALSAVGLVAVIAPEQVFSRTVPAGSVVTASPDSGTLTAGGKVTLTISKGPRMIEVPNLVGKQVDVATKELKDLGFEVNVENFLGGFFGTVRIQTPEGGLAPEGSTIVLKVV
ncbi:serine/threonine protein kinase/beta-lactam-binding protein with PASTA domain [Arthrobacter sp. UYCu511]|uniref:Stk1 family PASTA domain-containing Ser/Thr kinase n=1 Tax=Arthrobacter sp. UYCu511 TaxID=3156337 RepID=UPI003397BA65